MGEWVTRKYAFFVMLIFLLVFVQTSLSRNECSTLVPSPGDNEPELAGCINKWAPGSSGIAIDLSPNADQAEWIIPIQAVKGAPFLIAEKSFMVREFVNLKNAQNQKVLGLNTIDKPVWLEAKVGTKTFVNRVIFYNWFDYSVEDPFSPQTIRTYAFDYTYNQPNIVLNDFTAIITGPNLANDKKLDKVRNLVFTKAIDGVNFTDYVSVIPSNSSSVGVSGKIDTDNDIIETNETNNSLLPYDYDVRKFKDIGFLSYFAGYDANLKGFEKKENELVKKSYSQMEYLTAAYPLPDVEVASNPIALKQDLSKLCGIQSAPSSSDILKCLKKINSKNKSTYHEIYFVPHDFLSAINADGVALNSSRIAFVSENADYYTSAHEMGHQFGLGEQYFSSNPYAMEAAWYGTIDNPQFQERPFGFKAMDGWDGLNSINYKDLDANPNAQYILKKINTKPFNQASESYLPGNFNNYSFMGGSPQVPGDSANYYIRWTDFISMSLLWNKLTEPISAAQNQRRVQQNVVTVSGIIYDQNNEVEFDPFFVWNGEPDPVFDGNFLNDQNFFIEIIDQNTQLVVVQKFVPSMITENDQNILVFSSIVSFPPNTSKILIKRNGNVLGQKIASQNFPIVGIDSTEVLGQDFFRINWNAIDKDNDNLFFSVEYSPNGIDLMPVVLSQQFNAGFFDFNAASFPGSKSGFLRFTVTDGVNTSSADTQTFIVSNKHSTAAILFPDTNSSYGLHQNILFNGFGFDGEDGFLPNSSFSWNSDLNGFLGIGQDLNVSDLNIAGIHTITLTVTDSNGLQAADSIDLNIVLP